MYRKGKGKTFYTRGVNYGTLYPRKKLSNITPRLKDIIKNWILNHPNVIKFPGLVYVLKIGKIGSPNKRHVHKHCYRHILLNYITSCLK